jgi:hypothetical protein
MWTKGDLERLSTPPVECDKWPYEEFIEWWMGALEEYHDTPWYDNDILGMSMEQVNEKWWGGKFSYPALKSKLFRERNLIKQKLYEKHRKKLEQFFHSEHWKD